MTPIRSTLDPSLCAFRRAAWACIRTATAAALLAGCVEPTAPPDDPRRAVAFAERIFGAGRVRWFTPDSVGAWTMHPLLDGTRVYFERDLPLLASGAVLGKKEIRALDRATGAVLWKAPFVSAENAAVAGSVVGASWGALPMFDRVSGAPAHVYRFSGTSLSSNLVSDGARFYVGSHNGHVVAVDPRTGTADWDRDLAGGPSTVAFGLALSGDALAVTLKHFRERGAPTDSGIVAVLDRATGAPRWRVALGGGTTDEAIVDEPVIASGLVVALTQGHEVHAFELGTGRTRWRRSISFSMVRYGSNGLSACDGMVMAATGDLGVVALDAATGAIRWRQRDLGAGSLSRVDCSHGTVIVRGSTMRVLDARTGALRARYPLREPDGPREFYITSATRDAESLYIGTTYGYARVDAP
jgi:outer membrane protein assembly factor BamB